MSDGARAWDFIVRRHAAPGVEAACLALQDAHGQCIALLMWRAWTLDQGHAVGPDLVGRAVETARTWHGEAIAPLRAVRRRLSLSLPGLEETGRRRLRQGLLDQELAIERALVETLVGLAPDAAATLRVDGTRGAAAAVQALAATARRWGGIAPDDLLAKLAGA